MSDEKTDRTSTGIGFGRAVFFILLCALIALPFTPIMRKIAARLAPEAKERIVIKEVEVPEVLQDPDEPLPTGFVRYTKADTQRLWSEVDVSATVDAQPGGAASRVRKERGSYEIAYQIKLTIPEPSTSLEQLSALNPELPKMLPDLAVMLGDCQSFRVLPQALRAEAEAGAAEGAAPPRTSLAPPHVRLRDGIGVDPPGDQREGAADPGGDGRGLGRL